MARIGNFCWVVHCYVGSEEGNKTCAQSALSHSVTVDVQRAVAVAVGTTSE
jgi:hypothetical protein